MKLLEVEQLSLQLSQKLVLNQINCTLTKSAITTILGPNGAGKTMLLRCLAGIQPISSGIIRWLDFDHEGNASQEFLSKARSWTPLSQALPFEFTVEEIVLMGRFPCHNGLPGSHDIKIAQQSLERLAIADLRKRIYNSLSRGEQTKVDIARSIAHPGGVLFLDEPFANLDIDAHLMLCGVLQDLSSEGRTIILSHHDLHTVPHLAQRIIYMKDGCLLAEGPTEELFQKQWIELIYGVEAHFYHEPTSNMNFLSFKSKTK